MDVAKNVRDKSGLKSKPIISAPRKLNNILSNIQNIVPEKCFDDYSSSQLPLGRNHVKRNSSSPEPCEEKTLSVACSRRKKFVFSEDEGEDAHLFKSSHCNRTNSSEFPFRKNKLKSNSNRTDLGDTSNKNANKMEDLVTQLNAVNIDDSDVDDYRTADSEPEATSNNTKCFPPFKSKNCEKSKEVRSKTQKENIDVTKRMKKLTKSRTKRATPRKDSFIVSDDSSISDDADDVTIYHQIITKSIRADVRRMTPKALKPPKPRPRKNVPTYDDRMFSAYIITKRSGSEYSSDDEENQIMNDNSEESKAQISLPSSSNSNFDDETSEVSREDSSGVHNENVDSHYDSSSNAISISEPKRKNYERVKSPLPVSRNRPRKFSWISTDDDSSSSDEIASKSTEKSMSFLKSLSNPQSSRALHPDAPKYIKNFKKLKEELASRLFEMFNREVFKNQLPSDLKIEWNARLTSCAGKCSNGKNKAVIGPNNECLRTSRIVLSTKILESPDRLRDTLIHEMCHAATWIIDRECGGHGPLWKSWAVKAMKAFPELPLIERCHNYSIKTKFKYRCVRCGYTIGRHSKSLKVDVQLCGFCNGVFELVVENAATSKILPKFASFVQENYSKIKSEKPDLKHKEIMKELSENFASTKISN